MTVNNKLNFAAIYHVPESVYAYPEDYNKLIVRIKTAKLNCKKILCKYKNIYEHTFKPYLKEMDLIASDAHCDYYETSISLDVRRFKYYFEIYDNEGLVWNYSSEGLHLESENYNEYFFYPFILDEEISNKPEWAREGIIYQIFIDRFMKSGLSDDTYTNPDWNSLPKSDSFFGGDIRGIKSKLDYIASLGVTIIYLSPIFLSETNHKYDTIDYYRIDPSYGTVDEVIEFVNRAHDYGIKVILDAVFNHSGNKNPLFLDVIEKGSNSKYFKWFCISGDKVELSPPNYDSFAGLVPEMPRFNTSNPQVQEYLINVGIYWTKTLNIDGWRLDVADEVSHDLWKNFRKKLKAIKPDLFILGEVWNRATKWLHGDEFDSVTNYKFRKYLVSFASNSSISNVKFWNNIVSNEMNYKTDSLNFLVNLVSSHDVKRISTQMGGDKNLVKLIFGVMMTYRGIPLLYYGDEIGLEGNDDPDNRRAMIWEEENQDLELKNFIKGLSKLRKDGKIFTHGDIGIIKELPDRIIGFERNILNGEKGNALILANFSSEIIDLRIREDRLSFGEYKEKLTSYFDGRVYEMEEDKFFNIYLEGYGFMVLV